MRWATVEVDINSLTAPNNSQAEGGERPPLRAEPTHIRAMGSQFQSRKTSLFRASRFACLILSWIATFHNLQAVKGSAANSSTMRPSIEALSEAASVRPGMSEEELPASVVSVKRAYEGKVEKYNYDGFWSAWVSADGRIKTVNFPGCFPSEVLIGSLRIGMSRAELAACHPSMQSKESFPDGSEVIEFEESKNIRGRALLKHHKLLVLELALPRARNTWFQKSIVKSLQRRYSPPKISKDPDVRLQQWVREAENLGLEPKVARRYVKWLRSGTPDLWHQAARNWNWDYGVAPLAWIVAQPQCDLATAVLVHYDAEPGFYRPFENNRDQVPAWALETFDLIHAIRGRVAAGFYVRREIALDSRRAYDDAADRVSPDLAFEDNLPGRDFEDGAFNDGFPEALTL